MTPLGFAGGPTIAGAIGRPYDNFTIIRLALALAVVVSHSFSVTSGSLLDEPLTVSTGFTLGEHAVNGFFAISGFLVTMSFARRGARDYVVARALRIAPGLVAATLVTGLIIGAVLTRLPLAEYFAHPGLWRFVVATLTSFKSAIALPGVFADNPYPFSMGTVWTLKYEVICYLGVLLFGFAGLLIRPWVGLAFVTALFLALIGLDLLAPDASKGMQTTLRLIFLFAAGGALWIWREHVRLSVLAVAVLAAATWLCHGTPLYKALLFATEAYGVVWLALAPGLSHPGLDPKADLSYGAYLYGWPIQQALHQLFPSMGPIALLGPALVATLAAAALSWFLVEKPALSLKARVIRGRPPQASPHPAI
jgi:peptidoglycan/LPS O-acetylase OafA/YrhL